MVHFGRNKSLHPVTYMMIQSELMYLEVGETHEVLPGVLLVVLLVARVSRQPGRQLPHLRVLVVVAEQQRMVRQLAHVHHHRHAALFHCRVDLEMG